MTKHAYRVILGLGLLLLPVVASAQSGSEQADPCGKDASRFCKDAVPDEAKIAACLKANQSKLNAACRKSFAERTKGM